MSGHRAMYVAGLALAATAGVLITSPWTRASVTPMSRAALASTFESDIRHVVYEWDPGDPRSEADRRKALLVLFHVALPDGHRRATQPYRSS